ncbi:MAG TPA: plasmid stabilization protein [Verrucomicrobiales bacterium]|nr:plasmid stabilization protein [Verrucomicrobiales bacterium]
MKAQVIRSFEKDVRSIRDKKLKVRLGETLAQIAMAKELAELSDVVPMSGHPGFYRIRIGEYRLGFYIQADTLILARFLHRREIYRFFP